MSKGIDYGCGQSNIDREDGSCRCNDPTHVEMNEWGYRWDGRVWTSPPEGEDE